MNSNIKISQVHFVLFHAVIYFMRVIIQMASLSTLPVDVICRILENLQPVDTSIIDSYDPYQVTKISLLQCTLSMCMVNVNSIGCFDCHRIKPPSLIRIKIVQSCSHLKTPFSSANIHPNCYFHLHFSMPTE